MDIFLNVSYWTWNVLLIFSFWKQIIQGISRKRKIHIVVKLMFIEFKENRLYLSWKIAFFPFYFFFTSYYIFQAMVFTVNMITVSYFSEFCFWNIFFMRFTFSIRSYLNNNKIFVQNIIRSIKFFERNIVTFLKNSSSQHLVNFQKPVVW